MAIAIDQVDLYVHTIRTRMPFRYGIAAMTALPHLFVQARARVNGCSVLGLAADSLPPKWFTKHPDTSFQEDLAEMFAVIRSAAQLAPTIGTTTSVFDFWWQLYAAQREWAAGRHCPPLLWNFGVSLVERAAIDAFCRATSTTFARALRYNTLGVRLDAIHHELTGLQPASLLPSQPLTAVAVRHTVGLSDPLADADIPPGEQLDDGLPQSLEASIRAYGLTHFKIKLCGDAASDRARLRAIAGVLDRCVTTGYALTLDGNEQYCSVAQFRELWQALADDAALRPLLNRLLFVEQPLRRDVALGPAVAQALHAWRDRPPIIIDESDATLESLPQALAAGYVGTSHKNCKGVFKGVANACLLAQRRRAEPARTYVMSCEDLSTIGPVALPQDLAVIASLGIPHAERNGHHYFTGLSMFPDPVQARTIVAHPDLYERHQRGYAALQIRRGLLALASVVAAPFGVGLAFDPALCTPLAAWEARALDV